MVALANEEIRYADRSILTYQPLPAAKMFHQSQAKFRWLLGGNRSGKKTGKMFKLMRGVTI